MPEAILAHSADNVATCIENVSRGDEVSLKGGNIDNLVVAGQDIPFGHKVSVTRITAGSAIVKYGEVIGEAKADISRGAHVHVHNIRSLRAQSE